MGLALAGCQTAARPIFPEATPALVWPPPPDVPRIRYVGELRGEASLHHRVQGWAAVRQFLAGPPDKITFSRPSAVAGAGEKVYVADTGLGVVHLLDLATREYQLLRGAPDDPLQAPLDLTAAGGQLVVVDRARAAVDVFGLSGEHRATCRWPEVAAPVAIAWDPRAKLYWIADAAAHAVVGTRDLRALERRIGQRGTAPGQFNYPTALAASSAVGLVVADAMNFRVQVFDVAGLPVSVFGRKGDAAGDFARPRGIALDSDGHIYVTDNQFENVQLFDRSGQVLMAFGREGGGRGEFALPGGIWIDSQDRVWVADGGNGRVQVFQYLRAGPAGAQAEGRGAARAGVTDQTEVR